MAAKRVSPDAVIDLTLDSDDEQELRLGNVRQSLYNGSKNKRKKAKTESNDNYAVHYDDVEIIDFPPPEDRKPAATTAPTAVHHDGVEIVSAPAPQVTAVDSAQEDTDAELQVVGTKNQVRLPHNRCSCTTHKFRLNPSNRDDYRTENEKHCDLCYCYVCDTPVKECKSWNLDAKQSLWYLNHCNATDEHNHWVQRRRQVKAKGSVPRTQAATARSLSRFTSEILVDNLFKDLQQADIQRNRSPTPFGPAVLMPSSASTIGNGPFKSDHPLASADPVRFPACVKCAWRNRRVALYHRSLDLRCLKCGRATIEARSLKNGGAYHSKETDYFLGTKTIGFRIIPSDLRKMQRYRSSWESADATDPAWKYDESDIQADVFKYRIGANPTAQSIIDLVPEWDADKLRAKNEEGIVLDNPNDIPLLRILARTCLGHNIGSQAGQNSFHVDIKANWKKQERIGLLTVRLYLPAECTSSAMATDTYTRILGCWFDIFPLALNDIGGVFKASLPSFSYSARRGPTEAIRQKLEHAVTARNQFTEQAGLALSLTSSSGKLDVGGVTNNDNSLQGILKKFCKESFFSAAAFSHAHNRSTEDWEKISKHREQGMNYRPDHDYILSNDDRNFAALCLVNSAARASKNLKSTRGVLDHLENLGHESELICEGLSTELLAFQKQTLKWALERETISGGIQSYFWAKIPGQDLYFNPILSQFRNDKPVTVRGGIIAEEMGLGKTVISLALILKHPAPQLPLSGSRTSSLAATATASDEHAPQWDKDLHDRDSALFPKRGSILSQGTLVICPVSLVGQWIEEAKNKLVDPGLIYPYHGSARNRDPLILAKNAIVVTTYQILASDDTYHRARSSDPKNFCPPLEQVRWWRVICDEGHSLRQPNTNRNRSVSSLVADHKWLVTGTPVNTSIKDLKSQFKFIGIENVDAMFAKFCSDSRKRESGEIGEPHELLFFLRSVMMRHTQKQTYRGTGTTLMSLPPKTERSIEISLSRSERKEYDLLDNAAKTFYIGFKLSHARELSSHYLKLSQKLTPMRVACSGGRIPLSEGKNGDDGGDMNECAPTARKKSVVQYSDFSFTAKFDALIKELKLARDKDPTSKSLVFSQYNSTLEWLKLELPNHGFQFRTLCGSMSMKQRAKSLHDFQADPPTTIFLLSMTAGNCGINLTQANRVFLMEPGFNPALEKQAIGRVHRLGQKRKVEVLRLLVKDSIETRIHKFLKKKYGKPSFCLSEASGGSEQEENRNVIGLVGNIATERPKSKIMADEFDILFGVHSASPGETSGARQNEGDADMPDSAKSLGFI